MKKRHTKARRAHRSRTLSPAVLALAVLVTFSSSGLLLARVMSDPAERPGRKTEAQRDAEKEKNRKVELIGNKIEQIREATDGELDFEAVRAMALEQLGDAVATYQSSSENAEAAPQQKACFRDDRSVTFDRSECGIQSEFFGRGEDEEEFEEEDYGGFYVSDDAMGSFMNEEFRGQGGPMMGDMDLEAIVDEAMSRLESALPMVENAEEIEDGLEWLEEIRGDLAAGDIDPSEYGEYADEIFYQLQPLQRAMEDIGGQFMGQSMESVLTMMDTMMNGMLPWILQLFKDEGLPVSARAMAAYEEARAMYKKNASSCRAGDMSACSELGDVMGHLEAKMKPDMEEAIMNSDNPDLMETIEARMQEVMGDMMGPSPGMMPPPGYEHMMPPGFDPSQFEGNYGDMMEQYGY